MLFLNTKQHEIKINICLIASKKTKKIEIFYIWSLSLSSYSFDAATTSISGTANTISMSVSSVTEATAVSSVAEATAVATLLVFVLVFD